MKKNRIMLLVLSVFMTVTTLGFPLSTSAAFNANNLMDNLIFNDSNSMSAAQIDAFLNSFPNSCISTNNGFTSPDVIGYNPSQGYLYGGNVSAGTVISHATQAYDLNPRVILTTLQKEQSLVTGGTGCHMSEPNVSWPFDGNISYSSANPGRTWGKTYNCPRGSSTTTCTNACGYSGGCGPVALGYDCPGYCYTLSQGFSKQVVKATWKMKFVQQRSEGNYNWNIQKPGWNNSDDPGTSYSGYMTQGYLKRSASSDAANYDGLRPIDSNSKTVHLDNGATASLYSYTPFTSGNQSFVSKYEGWWGSSTLVAKGAIGDRYNQLGGGNGSMGQIVANEVTPDGIVWWQQFQNGHIIGTGNTGFWESKGGIRARWGQLGYQTGSMGYPIGGENYDGKGWWQPYENGYIIGSIPTGFWESGGTIRDRWGQLGYQTGSMGYPIGTITSSGATWWQPYENGYIIGKSGTGFWESKGGIRARWGQLGYQTGSMGYPIGGENYDGKGWWQPYENGYIIGSIPTGFWESKGGIRDRWAQLGYQNGGLGYPVNAVATSNSTSWQGFQAGYIIGSSVTGFWESTGSIRDYWAGLGYQSGVAGLPTGPIGYDSATKKWSQTFEHGTIYHVDNGNSWFVSR